MLWGGVITSCSNGSEEEYQPNIKTISDVEDVTFTATKESVGEENTNIVFTYDRSANGAKEKITIKDCNIEVLFNGEKIKTINNLDFALNEYGDFMGDNATQYQCKISIGKKVSPNDIVKVVFISKTGDVSGEGAESAKIDTLTVSLIDNDKDAGGEDNYYNELVENGYQKLFPNGYVGGDTDGEQGNGGDQGNDGGNQGQGGQVGGNGSGGQGQVGGGNNGGSQGGQQGNDGGNKSGGSNQGGGNNDGNQTGSSLELTSIIEGIVSGENVWDSGTKTVKEADGSYTVTAAGEGVGTWGGKIAAIPVQISAGDLVGFSHIVVTEVDISGFTLNEDSEEHPAIELKIANDDDKKVKVINVTKLLKNNKIEIPLADVGEDILKDASKVMLNLRGTGTVKIKDISKAKDSSSSSSGSQGNGGEEGSSSELNKTSIIGGIVVADDVWGSGTSITKSGDVYVVVAGTVWDKEGMASIPVSFGAGDLNGYEFIVLDGVDINGFKLRGDSDEYPSIELKITYKVGEEEQSKIISATKLLKDNKIEIPLANVEEDFLKKGSQIMFSFRGTGTLKITDISKANKK